MKEAGSHSPVARKARVEYAGACYHVINGGKYRSWIFETEGARRSFLEFYPELKPRVNIHWVDFARPRPDLVALLGEENQGCPVLVLGSEPQDPPARIQVRHANGHAFVADEPEIGEYLAHTQGIGRPH